MPSLTATDEDGATVSIEYEYDEPAWRSVCKLDWRLDVVKSGVQMPPIDFKAHFPDRSYLTVGRFPGCDIVLDHPSVSRVHAIIQHRVDGAVCIFDLASTHRTFMNKKPLDPRTYYRLHSGHYVVFGCSTRIFFLTGADDSEVEVIAPPKYTNPREAAEEQRRVAREAELNANGGVSWGMGDDAVDEEEEAEMLRRREQGDEDAVDGDAAAIRGSKTGVAVQDDGWYESDPKKFLKMYLEREGGELKFDVEESGPGHARVYTAHLKLPVETGSGYMTVTGTASRARESEKAAILEACRFLNSEGILRAPTAAQRKARRKRRYGGSDDEYNDSEDEFLDRTGDVEKRRRKKMTDTGGKLGTSTASLTTAVTTPSKVVHTFASLTKDLETLRESKQLLIARAADIAVSLKQADANGDEDELDQFMAQVGSRNLEEEKKKVTDRLQTLLSEERELEQLITFAAPTMKPIDISTFAQPKPTAQRSTSSTEIFAVPASLPRKQQSPESIEPHPHTLPKTPLPETPIQVPAAVNKKASAPAATATVKPVLPVKKAPLPKPITKIDSEVEPVWVPPVNQSGDGRTSLNDKFGY